ncbi:unnamed protein product [Porites evermanni]|uniref:Uncharacterized protein n=1 Tax=Porites evermanni TaxID=104178 RepID=A0ABN8LTE3_9CNID|nr:unnamed protein product [Porites evermanni]
MSTHVIKICNAAFYHLHNIRRIKKYLSRDSSNQSLLLNPPKGKMLVTLGDRSFSAAAPFLWNSLPAEVRDIQSLAIFKCKLKTYLFRAAFSR